MKGAILLPLFLSQTLIMKKEKAIMNWSGGKDSALALYALQNAEKYELDGLLTTINEQFNRVSMHGLREELLDLQAERIGLPLHKIKLPFKVSMDIYNKRIGNKMQELKDEGLRHSVFGDIFLEDLRAYREKQLEQVNFKGVFPIWGKNTTELIHEFVDLGFKAVLICVNAKHLGKEFLGREIDLSLLNDLPKEVDPCGENGEYHSFVYDGPIFSKPIAFEKGDIVSRSYGNEGEGFDTEFHFLDLELKG